MKRLQLFKKPAMLAAITLSSYINADQPFGIIGGENNTNAAAYAAFISSSGIAIPINTGISGEITTVTMNSSGLGIIGGINYTGNAPYAAFVSSSGIVTPIITGLSNGNITQVAINSSGLAIIGGDINPQLPYAALVSPFSPGAPVVITPGLPATGNINSVAINSSGQGIIGGLDDTGPAYAAIVSPSGKATTIPIGLSNGVIRSVAINDSGLGIIGGQNSNATYAAIVSPSGTPTPITPVLSNGNIFSVAINSSGQGIIGGVNNNNGNGYAAFVSPSGIVTSIGTGISNGSLNAVAINAFGQAILGGQNSNNTGYAAFVAPSGVVTFINTGISNGTIIDVAINDFGQALIGGGINTGLTPGYAAIVSPSGTVTPINLNLSNGIIATVFLPLLSNIPTGSLSGNNLIFANYINKNAPQDAFYLAPSVFEGTLAQALESAAPTRNAFSVYTASNNMFYLTTGLSNHLHNRSRHTRNNAGKSVAVASMPEDWKSGELLASISPKIQPTKCKPAEKTNSIWFEAFGALAYQKPQHQTPGFDPSTGAVILAYDGKVGERTRLGAGAAYLYTHIHEKQGAGHSNINQEDLFIYTTWENKRFYVDGSVLGGLFQTDQVRKIKIPGFNFKSTSKPHGWQLLPHLELGYHHTWPEGTELTINPFIMVDWANAWQGSFKEKGTSPFNVGQKPQHSSLLRSEVSLRMYETVFFDAWDLIFQEKAGYVNVHSFGAGKVNAFLVGSPGTFTVTTLTGSQNLGVAEFAMIFAPHASGYPTGTIFYQGEFGSKYQSHQVALEVAWRF